MARRKDADFLQEALKKLVENASQYNDLALKTIAEEKDHDFESTLMSGTSAMLAQMLSINSLLVQTIIRLEAIEGGLQNGKAKGRTKDKS